MELRSKTKKTIVMCGCKACNVCSCKTCEDLCENLKKIDERYRVKKCIHEEENEDLIIVDVQVRYHDTINEKFEIDELVQELLKFGYKVYRTHTNKYEVLMTLRYIREI